MGQHLKKTTQSSELLDGKWRGDRSLSSLESVEHALDKLNRSDESLLSLCATFCGHPAVNNHCLCLLGVSCKRLIECNSFSGFHRSGKRGKHHRQGLCASSVQLGAWGGVGMAVDSGVSEQLEAQGMSAVREEAQVMLPACGTQYNFIL